MTRREVSDWRTRAACLDEDPELFFPIGSTGPAAFQIQEAKAVCYRCEVMDTCLRWALDTGQDYGVWGGLSEDERRTLKRRNARNARATAPPPAPPAPPKKTRREPTTRANCGTANGYRGHTDRGEHHCEPCREWRQQKGGKRVAECGTANGYRAHSDRKERACDPCRAAKAAESAEYRDRTRKNRTSAA